MVGLLLLVGASAFGVSHVVYDVRIEYALVNALDVVELVGLIMLSICTGMLIEHRRHLGD
jgi:hypothetical protein